MVPFRIFDRENKEMWIVVNYHPGGGSDGNGNYLLAKEDDTEKDGEMTIKSAEQVARCRLVDFMDDGDGFGD